ncbi:PH domain-containing protein [Thermosphaera sp.]
MNEQILYRAHPSLWRQSPLAVAAWLLLALLGGLFAFAWVESLYISAAALLIVGAKWVRCQATTLTVTDRKIVMRRGLLARHESEILHRDVRNVQVVQSAMQRIMGVGTVAISSAATGGIEIEVSGLRQPRKAAAVIDAARG